jgi:hypothetical protein
MKTPILILLVFFASIYGYAQLAEGHVYFEVELDESSHKELHKLYKGSSFQIYFSEDFSRTEMQVGNLAGFECIVDYKTNKYLLLTNGLLGQKSVESTLMQVNSDSQESKDYEIQKTTDSREILGYYCTKYILKTSDGIELTYWTTPEIQASLRGHSVLGQEVGGFPLEFEIISDGFKLTIVATQIEMGLMNQEVLFDMSIPKGYREVEEDVFFGKAEPQHTAVK